MVHVIGLSKSSYLNARYRSYSSTEQLCIGGSQRITVFLHENITCRLEFHNDFRYFGTQIPNIFYLVQNYSTFFSAAVLVVLKIQDVNLKIKI